MNLHETPEIFNAHDALALARRMASDPHLSQDLSGFARVATSCLTLYAKEGGPINQAKAQVLAERLATVAPGRIVSTHWPLQAEG
ncbi:MAG TPA: hypothetical protein DCG48_03950 [Rhodospirillaceae bacterium]|nr:hypothetical protein [Rhodospirillaceae bacterium]